MLLQVHYKSTTSTDSKASLHYQSSGLPASPSPPSPCAGCSVAPPSSQHILLYWAFVNITFCWRICMENRKNPLCWICFWSDSLNSTRCYKILNIFHFGLIEVTDTIERNLFSFKWNGGKQALFYVRPQFVSGIFLPMVWVGLRSNFSIILLLLFKMVTSLVCRSNINEVWKVFFFWAT